MVNNSSHLGQDLLSSPTPGPRPSTVVLSLLGLTRRYRAHNCKLECYLSYKDGTKRVLGDLVWLWRAGKISRLGRMMQNAWKLKQSLWWLWLIEKTQDMWGLPLGSTELSAECMVGTHEHPSPFINASKDSQGRGTHVHGICNALQTKSLAMRMIL